MYLDTNLTYPVLISVNLLVTTPSKIVPPQPISQVLPPTPIPATDNNNTASNTNQAESEISTIGLVS